MIVHSIALFWTAMLKATVAFVVAFQVAFALRRASASARYFLWTSSLTTALVLPLLTLALRPPNALGVSGTFL